MVFRSYVKHFWCFCVLHLWDSEAALGNFSASFRGLSVLHCHCVWAFQVLYFGEIAEGEASEWIDWTFWAIQVLHLWDSEDTLGSFSALLCGFSVSFTGMVFPFPGAMFWAAVSVFGVFCSRVAVLVTSFWSFWKGFRPPVQGSAPCFWRLYSFPFHLIPPHLPPADRNRHTYRRNNTHINTKTHTNTPKNKHNAQNLCICSIKIVSSNKIQCNKELACTI